MPHPQYKSQRRLERKLGVLLWKNLECKEQTSPLSNGTLREEGIYEPGSMAAPVLHTSYDIYSLPLLANLRLHRMVSDLS